MSPCTSGACLSAWIPTAWLMYSVAWTPRPVPTCHWSPDSARPSWLFGSLAIVAVIMLLNVAVVMHRRVIGVVRWVALAILLAVVRAVLGRIRRRLPRLP